MAKLLVLDSMNDEATKDFDKDNLEETQGYDESKIYVFVGDISDKYEDERSNNVYMLSNFLDKPNETEFYRFVSCNKTRGGNCTSDTALGSLKKAVEAGKDIIVLDSQEELAMFLYSVYKDK